MTLRVRVTPEAQADLADARDWYETASAGLGDDFLDEVEATLRSAADWPNAAPVVEGTSDAEALVTWLGTDDDWEHRVPWSDETETVRTSTDPVQLTLVFDVAVEAGALELLKTKVIGTADSWSPCAAPRGPPATSSRHPPPRPFP